MEVRLYRYVFRYWKTYYCDKEVIEQMSNTSMEFWKGKYTNYDRFSCR